MPTTEICPCRDSFVFEDYLAGRLDEAQAEAFERHALECEHCREMLETAALTRAALSEEVEPAFPVARRRRTVPRWLGMALAASLLLLVAAGIWRLRTPERETFRGAEEQAVEAVMRGPRLTVQWRQVEGADVYRVRLFSDEGDLIVEHEVANPPATVELDDLGPLSEVLWVDVTALDPLREPLWRSPPRSVTRE